MVGFRGSRIEVRVPSVDETASEVDGSAETGAAEPRAGAEAAAAARLARRTRGRERQTIGEGMWFMIGYSAARAVAAVQHDIDANAP